jgi:hypothetical protein
MSEWSDFHNNRRPRLRDLSALPRETIGKQIIYRGYLVTRSPNPAGLWTICNHRGMGIAGLGGAFTNVRLAQHAIDRHISDKQKEEETVI